MTPFLRDVFMVYFLLTLSVALLLVSFWLFFFIYPVRKSAKVNCILFDPIHVNVEIEPTFARKVGKRVRYLLYLWDLFAAKIRHKSRKILKDIREFFGKKIPDEFSFPEIKQKLWRKKSFFPSFEDWWYKLKLDERSPAQPASIGYAHPMESVHLSGTMMLPTRAYLNRSCVVQLSLLPELNLLTNESAKLSITQIRDDEIYVQAELRNERRLLKVELKGVGINVTPLEQEIQSGESMFFRWGCSFPYPGLQMLDLRITLLDNMQSIFGHFSHHVNVVIIDHLTKIQIQIIAGVFASIGFVGTLIGIFKALGILNP